MNDITFTVPGKVIAWQRAGNSGGAYYTQPKTRDYQKQIGWAAKAAGVTQIVGPVKILVMVYLSIPSRTPLKARQSYLDGSKRPVSKPDGDNVLKTVADALNGIAYIDDAQVVDMTVSKFWATESSIQVKVGAA